MPILVPIRGDAPLEQGDLLEGVRIFASGTEGAVELDEFKYALVISRDCAGAQGARVLVAGVKETSLDVLKDAEKDVGFDRLRRVLQGFRDGGETPDSVYLGHLPGADQRLTARLNAICSVELPDAAARQTWLSANRRARLDDAFVRALPTRIFWATARVGHDDHRWFPDADLRLLVVRGRRALADANAAAAAADDSLHTQTASGQTKKPQMDGLRREAEKRHAEANKIKSDLAPYEAEMKRRGIDA